MINKIINIIKVLLVVASVGFIAACGSTTTDPAELYKNQTAEQIFQGGERVLAKKEYQDAAKHFEGLDALYPFSKHSEQAQLDLIYAYYKDDNYVSASATAERFIKVYPGSPHVDYAYYMKGLADSEQNRTWYQNFLPIDLSSRDLDAAHQAYDDFNKLVQLYPNSSYAPDARLRMIYYRNLFAQHEFNIANYYYQRAAYVASANRASYILQHYNGAPQVPDALVILIKSYRALGLTEPADNALTLLRTNYPNSDALKSLH